jgi:hypothetical protein
MYLNPITVDGTTYNFTEESLKQLIKNEITLEKKHEAMMVEQQESYRKLATLRSKVYDFFTEAFEDGSDEATVSREGVNELLESIGSDALVTTWSATVEITVTVTGINASSPEEAEDIINDNIEVSGYNFDVHDQDVRVYGIERE